MTSIAAVLLFALLQNTSLRIQTTELPDAVIGQPYSTTVTATGGVPPYVWTVSGLPPGLSAGTSNGQLQITGTPTRTGSSDVTVTVRDVTLDSASKKFKLDVVSVLSITTASLPSGTAGTSYSANLAASGGTPPYTWTIAADALPAGLTLSTTGSISGTPTTAGTFTFTVRATDNSSQTANKSLQITINAAPTAPLTITTTSPLPSATVGSSYSQTLSATGGTQPYSWSIQSGSLPSGLTLSSAGVVSGTPTASGTSNFTVQVADNSQTATKNFQITVNAPQPSTPTITTASPLPSGAIGAAYSQTLSAGGGTPPYAWSIQSGSLPPGLTLSSSGVISGTPSRSDTFSFTVQVSDAANQKDSKGFSLSIAQGQNFGTLAFTNVPDTMDPAQQITVRLSSSSAPSTTVSGTLNVTFTSTSAVASDDPAVQFSTGSRSVGFTIPANTTTAVFPSSVMLLTGTVAGTITLRADVQNGPTGLSVGSISVRSTAPRLTNVTASRIGSGLRVQITGYSPERRILNAQFGFDVRTASGTQRVDLSRSVQADFDAWYRSTASSAFGSSFLWEQTFAVQGDVTVIDTVTVTLTNSLGGTSSSAVRIAP